MLYEVVITSYLLMWYLLIITAVLFCISGMDDAFFDIYYWCRFIFRKWKTRNYEPLTYQKLDSQKEQAIAVLLPCWHEENVIKTMLLQNCYSVDYKNYDIFVGTYPNDKETINAVQQAANEISNIHCVIGKNPGPTNKASNLNDIYHFIKDYEKKHDKQYDIFVFHDSEDVIHPLSFKLYNYLIPKKDMIQLPVFPLEVPYTHLTHWCYADEFSENHTKDIIVREAIKGLVPSAGVGTAFSRKSLILLEKDNNGMPFAIDSLTEDYRTSLAINTKGLKQVFVTQAVMRTIWRKRFILFGRYIPKTVKEFIATRALFPSKYTNAVRQKTRWIIGIAFQEWNKSGWQGNKSTLYTLMHDRKTVFTHFINILGYFVFGYWLVYSFVTYYKPQYPALQEQFNLHPWVWYLIIIATILMCERLMQRAIACYRIYGLIPAILAIPRAVYGNFLNMHALIRAYLIYFFHIIFKKNGDIAWDKTEHQFVGSHVLIPYKKRLGDILLEKKLITENQLKHILNEHQKTGERLGSLIKKYQIISNKKLMELLALQYQLPLLKKEDFEVLNKEDLKLRFRHYNWLIKKNLLPIKVNNQTLILGIEDPSNEKLIKDAYKHTSPYKVDFVLLA